jgi:hypothetical protein
LGAAVTEDRNLRIVVRDSTLGEIQIEMVLPLIKSLERLDGLVKAAASDYVGWLWTADVDDKYRIEVRIEKVESNPQEDDDA